MIERRVEHGEYLVFEHLSAHGSLAHGIFTRRGGYSEPPYAGMNVAVSTGDDPARVQRNLGVIARAVGLPLVSASPIHGTTVTTIERLPGEDLPRLRARLRGVRADAMVTNTPGLGLFWGFGDCAPVVLYDPRQRAVGLAHAGWRGTAGAIVPKTIAAMGERFGTRPADLLVGIGPAIGACCYAIGDEVQERFAREPLAWEHARFVERTDPGSSAARRYLDVAESNVGQIRASGVPAAQIALSGYCTGCRRDLFYSHRCEGEPSGRFGAVIGLRQHDTYDEENGEHIGGSVVGG